MTTNGGIKVRLGIKEWIGLAGLALTPALGFMSWGVAMNERMAVVERQQEDHTTVLGKIADKVDLWVRIDERMSSLDKRVAGLESREK